MNPVSNIQGSCDRSRPSTFFWIKRDRSENLRILRGSVSLAVPTDNHAAFLSNDCEDWCLDNLTDGLLAEWKGLELHAHFASKADALLFRLRWM